MTNNNNNVVVDIDSPSSSPSAGPFRQFLSGAARWSLNRSCESEDALPAYDIFLGGSCGNTVWRREIVIPYLKKRSITYYDPQRPVWNENMIHEEQIAKENSKLFLFVLDPGTINATSFIEIAYFAARKAPKLVVVFLGRREWSDKAHPMDLPDRIRTVNLVEAILKRHDVPMLTSITDALDYVDEMIIGEKPWQQAIANPLQRLPYVNVKAKRAIQRTTRTVKNAISTFRSTWAKKIGAVLCVEFALILFLHFFVFTQIPIWLMIIPLLAFDYVALALCVLYLKLKMNRNRSKLSRKLVLNPPQIPRTITSTVTSAAVDASASLSCESSQLRNFRPQTQIDFVEKEIREHFRAEEKPKKRKQSRREKLRLNGCVTSPVGYDVFLSCSSGSELDWITKKAVPQLHKSGLTYTSAIMCDQEMRIPLLHTASHILYYIPSYRTFLSGMIEIAYFIGHSDWQVTVCVPEAAEQLDGNSEDPESRLVIERRNEAYQRAFCYLMDMARRRECRVFRNVEDSIKHISTVCGRETQTTKAAVLRSVVEKQHLVKAKTQTNLLR
ncbi:hypothetical protein M3Y96_00179600 [Aphelenchoides besseyi]|nr:hypothetical protein M3Y96_00179600 [Aphelenchoides besseyi]